MDERINAIRINSISAFKSDAFTASATIIPKDIKKFNKPIIATSGNITDSTIIYHG